jgi:hypothetical protein
MSTLHANEKEIHQIPVSGVQVSLVLITQVAGILLICFLAEFIANDGSYERHLQKLKGEGTGPECTLCNEDSALLEGPVLSNTLTVSSTKK